MSEHVLEITDSAFESAVLQSDQPVLVEFWAPWSGPSRILLPTVEKVAAKLTGRLKVVKVNVDESPETAGTYGIRSIPTLMWFKNGEVVDNAIGLLDEASLTTKCEAVLA